MHADLVGPMPKESWHKSWCSQMTTLEKAGFIFCAPKVKPSRNSRSSKSWTGKKIGALRTNCGGEFTSTAFNDFCQIHGIKRQLTQALTPQHNGVAERRNRTIIEKARSMCFQVESHHFFGLKRLTFQITLSIEDLRAQTKASVQKKSIARRSHMSIIYVSLVV